MINQYISLARYDKPHGALLLFYPCVWGLSFSQPDLNNFIYLIILFLLGSICMRATGCIWNDFVDRDIDRRVERTKNRPLAVRTVSIRNAIILGLFNLMVSLIVLLLLPIKAKIAALLSIPLIIIYPFMKRITWWPQLWLGLTFNWGIFVGWYSGTPLNYNFYLIFLYLGSIIWTVGYDTIYGHQDINDDIKIDVKSTAILYKDKIKEFIIVSIILSSLLWNISFIHFQLNYFFNLLLSTISIILIIKTIQTNFNYTSECNKLFNINSYGGLCISMFFTSACLFL